MNKEANLTKKNLAMTAVLQVVNIIHGFILPKIILSYFGSEVNGMISSITQFLNYIQLLEGGLGAVVMASLYKPLAEQDHDKVSAIIKATQLFFRRIALFYVVYATVMALIFPMIVETSFSYEYVATLVLIIAIGAFIQYFFALPYKLLINADRHGYVVSFAQILFLIASTVLTLVTTFLFPQVHVIKLVGAAAYVISPLIFCVYVNRHYKLRKDIAPDQTALSQRWNAFGQNLAYFIHNNTDIVLLSLFSGLMEVSVYSVYSLIIVSLKSFVKSLSDAVAPTIGRELVSSELSRVNKVFDRYALGVNAVTAVAFSCCFVLVVPFVKVYTAAVTDTNYDQPLFAYLLTIANGVYCFRDPFTNMIYVAGHIKQTSKYAYMEAAINIVLSLLLVRGYGLVGVGIGTVAAMVYRMLTMVYYVKKNILYRSLRKWVKSALVFLGSSAVSITAVFLFVDIPVTGYGSWFLYAVITGVIVCITLAVFMAVFYRRELSGIFRRY